MNHCLFCIPLTVACLAFPSAEAADGQQARHAVDAVFACLQEFESRCQTPNSRPFVTLAFAQSLDGKIAQRRRSSDTLTSNLAISGPESLLFSHGLRSIHDGILIGRSTAEIDSPQLTNRLYHHHHPCNIIQRRQQPRPIILDPNKRLADHILKCFPERPIVVVVAGPTENDVLQQLELQNSPCWDVLRVDCDGKNGLDLCSTLKTLKEDYALDSIMVEGGAATLRSFLQHGLYDCVCITINPRLVLGQRGISPFDDDDEIIHDNDLELIHVVRLGTDIQLIYIRCPKQS
jgi:riboflavin-specific deaminase-like protein